MRSARRRHIAANFQLYLFLLAAALTVLLIRPFIGTFFAALLLAVILQPRTEWIVRRLSGRRKLAAGLMTAFAALAAVLPVCLAGILIVSQASDVLDRASVAYNAAGLEGVVSPLPKPIDRYVLWLAERSPVEWRTALFGRRRTSIELFGDLRMESPVDALEAMQEQDGQPATPAELSSGDSGVGPTDRAPQQGEQAMESTSVPPPSKEMLPGVGSETLGVTAGYASRLLTAGLELSITVGLTLTALFFFLSTGESLLHYLVRLVPMDERRTLALLTELRTVGVGVFRATMLTAVAQSLVAGLAYWIADLPAPLLLILITLLAALIPVVGAGSVVAIAGVLVLLGGRTGMGIFLLIWGFGVVGIVDNFLKPILASDRTRLPSSMVFFSMVCGIAVFGPLGIVAGPLVISFFTVTARMAKLDREEDVTSVPKAQEAGTDGDSESHASTALPRKSAPA